MAVPAKPILSEERLAGAVLEPLDDFRLALQPPVRDAKQQAFEQFGVDDVHRAENDADPDAHKRIGAFDQDASRQRLLLDEPSMGLASTIADLIFECIAALHQTDRATLLLVEQRFAEAFDLRLWLCAGDRARRARRPVPRASGRRSRAPGLPRNVRRIGMLNAAIWPTLGL